MKNWKSILIAALMPLQAFAGLPPTSSKALGDATKKTTFNFDFPEHAPVRSGTTTTLYAPDKSAVNYVGLSTTWAPTSPNDRNFEATAGNWAAYDDGSTATPVDGSGGIATVVGCTRTTTAGEVQNGTGSLSVTWSAADGQGEGCAVVFNVPPAYQGKNAQIDVPFHLVSGTLVEGDWNAYVYRVTATAKLITPYCAHKMVGGHGTLSCSFPVDAPEATPANMQHRLILHRAVTTASAGELSIDDVSVGPVVKAQGMAGSDWASDLVWTHGGLTPTGVDIRYRRVGDSMDVYGVYTVASAAASTLYLGLPSGYAMDTAKLGSSVKHVGTGFRGNEAFHLWYDGSTNNQLYIVRTLATAAGYAKVNGSSAFNNGDTVGFSFRVPIAGWSSNVTVGNSSSKWMSAILAGGSRVTTTPTKLGEYRTLYKAVNQFTSDSGSSGTDTSPSQAVSAWVADGIKLFADAYNAAGSSGEPNRIEMYIGVDKPSWRMQCWSSTAHSGGVNTSFFVSSSTREEGTQPVYSSATGVLTIDFGSNVNSSTTTRQCGKNATNGSVTDCYCDVQVSENALSVGMDTKQVVSNQFNERIERATVTCSSSSSVTRQSGSWISSIGNVSSGACALTFATGTFSDLPSCVGSYNSNATGEQDVVAVQVTSATAATISFRWQVSAAATVNNDTAGVGHIICMGPR